ncbi:thiol reductant ABC exporter subunit CydC [Actinoplanes sp. NPDC049596]|uniref:amino acid ABC transporter ATP-binding/permease protein n=1 Tax=unclassified Actinoplanes TaxID=2626549 RepID=UPI003432A318
MTWFQLLRTASRPAAPGLLLAVLAGMGAAGAAVGLMATSAWLISRAALHPPVLHLMVAIVAVRAFGLGRGVFRYAERLAGHDAALRVLGRLRIRLFDRLAALAPAGSADFRGADLAQRLASDVDAVLDMLVRAVLPYVVAAVVGLGSVLLVGSLSPLAGAALAFGLLAVAVAVPLLQSAAARRADGRLAPLRGDLATATVDLLHGLPDLTAYGAMQTQLARLAAADTRLRQAEQRSTTTAGASAAVTALATGLSLLIGLAAGAVAVRNGTLPGELLAVIVLTPLAVYESIAGLPVTAQRFAAARASLQRLAEIINTPDPITVPKTPAQLPSGVTRPTNPPTSRAGSPAGLATDLPSARLASAAGPANDLANADSSFAARKLPGVGVEPLSAADRPPAISVRDVSASWVRGRTAVRDVSFELPAGARVALVGPSGSGKSTIAALLVRFLDPTAGRITLDGVDLRQLDPDEVRRVVGYLPEDAYLFDTTISANLRIARPGATDDELRAGLTRARLIDWIDTLPDGLETFVGEHGLALSGGQRRRLALARALLADFRVLILDEPTEHLDDETATALTHDLLAEAGDRSVLLITHRTDVAAQVDQVVDLTAREQAALVAVPEPV